MLGLEKPIELFCSYAHEDEPLLKKLETHLSLLKRQGLIDTWYDRQITAGTEWAQTIDGDHSIPGANSRANASKFGQ